MSRALDFSTYSGPDCSPAWEEHRAGRITLAELNARLEEERAARYLTEAAKSMERARMCLARARSYRGA